MDNKQLEDIAEKIIAKIPKKENEDNFSFVITVLMIISIVLTLIRIIQECNKTELSTFGQEAKCSYYGSQIKDRCLKRSWFTKRIIKRAIKKELSPDNYKTYGVDIMNAILDSGLDITSNEVTTLMEAANV